MKSWSTTQAVVALSSAEAELYALLKATSQTLGLISLASDFGLELSAKVRTDASAALGIVNRQGLWKLRHISVQYLWIQERVRSGDVKVAKIPGVENPADLFTKHLSADDMQYHMSRLGLAAETSRAATAPTLTAWMVSAQDPTRHGSLSQCVDGRGDEIDHTIKDHWQEDGERCVRIQTDTLHATESGRSAARQGADVGTHHAGRVPRRWREVHAHGLVDVEVNGPYDHVQTVGRDHHFLEAE